MAAETNVYQQQMETYRPVDTLSQTVKATLQTTAAGAIVAGVQNTMSKQNVGAMGIFTRSGGTIALFAGAGGAYQFTRDSMANLRQQEDAYNEAVGGFASGLVVGMFRRSIPFMLGGGASFAVVMAAASYSSGLVGFKSDVVEDEVERKEALKKMRRRPIEETVAELGEGRGIYAPGYEERRRQRLLEKYGVDVGQAQGAK